MMAEKLSYRKTARRFEVSSDTVSYQTNGLRACKNRRRQDATAAFAYSKMP